MATITRVVLWTTGTVSAFDERGELIPEYHGRFKAVREKIQEVYKGEWFLAEWGKGPLASFYPTSYKPLPW